MNDKGEGGSKAASATATNVNVNNTHAYRRGEYYRVELSTNNGSAAIWLGVTNRVVQSGTTNSVTGNVFLPKTPEMFAHDADGNLTNDGHWAYVWDGENRLTRLVAPSAIPTGARYALNFTNDWRGRRTSKVVSNWTGSAWSKSYEHKFVYDGWNLIATLDAANTLLYSFQWGTDLSGTMQGAGGVGGLVSMTVHSGASAGTYFYAFDGNGNVAALINAADGTVAARYEYGPFGELIRATGPLAFLNPFRFSTKFQDDESGFLYYGYRYYDPSMGRWLSRDPLGEPGFEVLRRNRPASRGDGPSPYHFVKNDPVRRCDKLGLIGSSAGAVVVGGVGGVVSAVVASVGQSRQNQQPECKTCTGSTASNPVYYDKSGCCINIQLICRNLDMAIGKLGFKHCYLSVRDRNGNELGTISAFADVPGLEDRTGYLPDGDMGTGGSTYPFTLNGDSCKWVQCAHEYATEISGDFEYSSTQDNSNTFVTRIIRHCGGSANFPWGAWGSDDL